MLAYTLYSIYAIATLAAAFRSGHFSINKNLTYGAGGVLMFSGLFLYAASVSRFGSFGQLSGLEDGELVTVGIYRYTRNPQILGWGLALLGAALSGRSGKALAFVAAYFLAHRIYFPFEERKLEHAFGDEYRRYLASTPRFLGLPG